MKRIVPVHKIFPSQVERLRLSAYIHHEEIERVRQMSKEVQKLSWEFSKVNGEETVIRKGV